MDPNQQTPTHHGTHSNIFNQATPVTPYNPMATGYQHGTPMPVRNLSAALQSPGIVGNPNPFHASPHPLPQAIPPAAAPVPSPAPAPQSASAASTSAAAGALSSGVSEQMLKQLMSNPALMNNFIEQLQKANIPLAALHQLLVQKKLIAPNQPLFPGHVITGASTSTAQSSHPTPPAHASPAAPAHATAPAQQTPTHPPSHHQTSAQSAIATSTTAPKPEEAPFGSFQYRKKLPKVPKKINADRATQLTLDLQSVLPDSEVLYRLVTFERQVDIFLRKRQLAMQEALPDQAQRKNTFPKTLRICVSNTCDNQPSGYHLDASQSSSLKELPSWTLKIEGRLVDSKTGVPEVAGKHGPVRKFSSFFKRIVIEFDKEQMAPDTNWFVEWNKAGVHDDVDGLEITRKGSREMAVNIGMYLDTERFSIGKDLASVLNLSHNQSYTKTAIILQLWSYVRSKGLQDSEARGHIKFDAPLRAVFAVDGAPYNDIPKLLHKHMHASDPIQIPFFLKLRGDISENEMWFELPVEVENKDFQIPLNEHQNEIEEIEKHLSETIEVINDKKRKRDFYNDFSLNPLDTIDDYLNSQIRDWKIATMAVVNQQEPHDQDFARTAEFYMQPLVNNAVERFLRARPTRFPQATAKLTNLPDAPMPDQSVPPITPSSLSGSGGSNELPTDSTVKTEPL